MCKQHRNTEKDETEKVKGYRMQRKLLVQILKSVYKLAGKEEEEKYFRQEGKTNMGQKSGS